MDNYNNVPKVPFDPGWNDPPSATYNSQQTTPNRPRNFLNKRVAFPLSGASANSPSPAPAQLNLPPLPSAPPITNTPRVISSEDIDVDSESTLVEVKVTLLQFLEDSSELGSKGKDIRRRIDVMEEMWSSGKLNKRVHTLMKELACALRDDQGSRADDIHRALMVDHVSAVGTWMPGVKQLIHHCIARSELLAIDKEQADVAVVATM